MPQPKSQVAMISSTKKSPRVLYWFRTDLRITDSPALSAAVNLKPEFLYPVWCFDPNYVYGHRVGINRWGFLLESMQSLSDELGSLNPRQKLHVVRGPPEEVLPIMWKSWGITHLVFEKDANAYSRRRDALIKDLAKENGIQVIDVLGRHLFDPEEIFRENKGEPTMTLHQWQSVSSKIGEVSKPSPTPKSLPDPGPTELHLDSPYQPFSWGSRVDMNSQIRTPSNDTCFQTLTGPKGDFAVPTLSELGFPSINTTSIRGGTSQAHAVLDRFLGNPLKVATFSKPLTAPTSIEPSTTLLSPYMKFGCIGVREIWWGCKDVIAKWKEEGGKGGKETKEPENMFGQLEFRDMYAAAEAGTEFFERIRGNKVCRYIDWGLQNQYDPSTGLEILPRPPGNPTDESHFKAWKEGQTGFPWIDASMRQLKQEGWIHHLARHSVACFLTRGQCYISWERGMEVFDDWDPASNPGNWMWLSCSAFFSQYFRVYGLVSWPQKTDKSGALVRKYCPELKDFPDKYIYAPHTAPLAIQQKAKCIIGKDYPHPILDEHKEKDRCIARLKNAFALGLHGDSKQVLDGTAADLLRQKHIESGALEVLSPKEKLEERGKRKREKDGDQSLDGFFRKSNGSDGGKKSKTTATRVVKDEREVGETEAEGKKEAVQGEQ